MSREPASVVTTKTGADDDLPCSPRSPATAGHALHAEPASGLHDDGEQEPGALPPFEGEQTKSCHVRRGAHHTPYETQDSMAVVDMDVDELDCSPDDFAPAEVALVFADEAQILQHRVPTVDMGAMQQNWEDDLDEGDNSARRETDEGGERFVNNEEADENETPENAAQSHVWSDREILSRFEKISRWQNLLSLFFVTGSVRVSVKSYEKFRLALNTLLDIGFPNYEKIPVYSTAVRTLLPILRSWGFVQQQSHTALLNTSLAGARATPNNEDRQVKCTIVQPSAWSAVDVSCRETWDIFRSASVAAEMDAEANAFERIETSPIVRHRQAVLETLSTFMRGACNEEEEDQVGAVCDIVYNLQFGTTPAFSEALSSVSHGNSGDNGNLTSVALIPVRTYLVKPCTHGSDDSTVSRMCIQNGKVPCLSVPWPGIWYPGDFCTSLQVPIDIEEVLVLVHHQAFPGRFDRRLELMCIPYYVSRRGISITEDACRLECSLRKVLVKSFRLQGQSFDTPLRTIPFQASTTTIKDIPSVGRLKSGMPYFVDRILLYSDGFSQYSFKQGSAGGINCLSLKYPPHLRRSRDIVRVLGLTPPGVATREGLRAIIPDLVKSATSGVVVRNAEGEDVVLFLDVVAYVCDYHEVGHVLDVVGSTGSAPCHLCSFLRYTGPENSGSRYGNTTVPNSANGCYARTRERVRAIRSSNITSDELASLGLTPEERAEEKDSPLIKFHNALREALKTTDIPKQKTTFPSLTQCSTPIALYLLLLIIYWLGLP